MAGVGARNPHGHGDILWVVLTVSDGKVGPWGTAGPAARSVAMMSVASYGGITRSGGAEIVDGATVLVAVVASCTEADLIVGMLRSHG
jgi:hypothetical protein